MSAPSQLVATHMQCLRIPRGCFKDSGLVWARRTGYDVAHVVTRAYAQEMGWRVDAPAPTAQEILQYMARRGYTVKCSAEECSRVFDIRATGQFGCVLQSAAATGRNLASALMKLWFMLCSCAEKC